MSAIVHRLTAAGPIVEIDQDVIAVARDLLERAVRGEIKGIGYFTVDGANAFQTDWVPGVASLNCMIGASMLLHARLMRKAVDSVEADNAGLPAS